ncbi:MAG: DUF5700 domain-containing putative Zn-dependent protease [Candidatus Bathyarchaeia archaeon]|jgi:hypothetical protein
MKHTGQQSDRHEILFDCSAIEPAIGYLRNGTDENLERLVSMQGSKVAYNHYLWSSFGSKLTFREFWKRNLERTIWSKQLETSIDAVKEYLASRQESQWLSAVLGYLPEGHVFRTTVYLITGYDNIVYGEDVALNLNFRLFHIDHREVVYYLVHELAHAGYFRYRQMPELAKMRTLGDLLDVVKLLTHLEGMGVISPMKMRLEEGGMLDNDYKVLLNDEERNRRVREYFSVLSRLESRRSQELRQKDFQVFEQMSGKTTRLWYVTGCHMAQKIEQERGVKMLRNLVKTGWQEFFETYRNLENPRTI